LITTAFGTWSGDNHAPHSPRPIARVSGVTATTRKVALLSFANTRRCLTIPRRQHQDFPPPAP
jgi:hypothetical protein